jgi:hypothetical protein
MQCENYCAGLEDSSFRFCFAGTSIARGRHICNGDSFDGKPIAADIF